MDSEKLIWGDVGDGRFNGVDIQEKKLDETGEI